MTYNFDTEIAKKYGLNEAIMLNNFIFWIKKNIANNTNNYDGNWWTFNSVRALKDLFPFWSESQIRRVLKSLIEQGVLIEGNYNKVPYDRTKWYAISKLKFEEFHLTISSNGNDEVITPIPDIKPDIKPDKKQDNKEKEKKEKKEKDFDKFWQAYPRKIAKAKAKTAFMRLYKEMPNIEELLSILERHKSSKQWKQSEYVPYASTWLNQKRWEDEVEEEVELDLTQFGFGTEDAKLLQNGTG